MKRGFWFPGFQGKAEYPEVDAFLQEVVEVCKKHGFMIGVGENYSSLFVEPISDQGIEFLLKESDFYGFDRFEMKIRSVPED